MGGAFEASRFCDIVNPPSSPMPKNDFIRLMKVLVSTVQHCDRPRSAIIVTGTRTYREPTQFHSRLWVDASFCTALRDHDSRFIVFVTCPIH